MKIEELYNLEETICKDYLLGYTYPWEALKELKKYIELCIKDLNKDDYNIINDNVYIHKTATIDETALILGPTIIGKNTEVRHSAYIRGSAIIGDNCVIGNSTEVKNSIIFNNVQVPHFNYVGDSILGFKSHMGAGSVTSNVKSDKSNVLIKSNVKIIETNLKKCGAFLGDYVEVGCNSVLNPGTVVGKNTIIYPLSMVRGVVKENSIYKNKNEIIDKE